MLNGKIARRFGFLALAGMLVFQACAPAAAPAPAPAAPPPASVASPAPAPSPAATAAPAAPRPTVAAPPAAAPTPVPATPTAAGPKRGGKIVLVQYQALSHLDTHQVEELSARMAATPIYDSLFEFDPYNKNAIIASLAEKWDFSPDGKKMTLTLRQGVKFHNGSPLTADDVVYTLNLFRDPPRGVISRYQALYKAITSIDTPSPNTLVLNLSSPSNSLMMQMASSHAAIYPKAIVSQDPANSMKNQAIGTGPFRLRKYTPDVSINYERNPGYWRAGEPYLDAIEMPFILETPTILAAFRTGRLDVTCQGSQCQFTSAQWDALQRELGDKVKRVSYTALSGRWFGFNPTKKPFDDVRVRQAINLALDRDQIIIAWAGTAEPAYYLANSSPFAIPESDWRQIPGFRKDKTADLAKAKSLLAEAGLSSGFTSPVNSRNLAEYVRANEIFREQMKALNITITPAGEPTPQFLQRLVNADYGIMLNAHAEVVGDPSETFANEITAPYLHFKDAELNQWVITQDQTIDPTQRKVIVDKIVQTLYDKAYVLAVNRGTGIMGYWSYVKNYPSPIGLYGIHKLTKVWVDR